LELTFKQRTIYNRRQKTAYISVQVPRGYRKHRRPSYQALHRATNTNSTRSSAVAVIADRTAYDIRYTSKATSYKFMNGWYARPDSTSSVYERTKTLSIQA